jgi:hypothetical protein
MLDACILFDIIRENKKMFQTSCGTYACPVIYLGCDELVNTKANPKIRNMTQSLMADLVTFVLPLPHNNQCKSVAQEN